jgi:hypothetical protein
MRRFLLPLFFLLAGLGAHAQGYLGVNAGGILGRTGEAQLIMYPKNEDWISFHVGGGYTAPGPFFFDKRDECLRNFFNHGWHVKAGFRNGITADLRRNHFFWGMSAIYSRTKERARQTYCDSLLENDVVIKHQVPTLGLALNGGWSWNVFRGKTAWDRLIIDFGMQVGTKVWVGEEFLSERNHVSGMGFGPIPFRRLHLEPMLMARYELWHGRYGSYKGRTVRH